MKSLTTGKRFAVSMAFLLLACSLRGDPIGSSDPTGGWSKAALLSSVPAQAPAEDLDFLSRAQAHIATREYWVSETKDGLQAPNRTQDLRSYFEPTGVRVHDRTGAGTGPLLGLQLVGLGRGAKLSRVAAGELSHHEGRVEIARAELGLTEWFENSEQGLEQGFTLSSRPQSPTLKTPTAPPTTGHDLVLELSLSGTKAILRGDDIALTTQSGRRLSYGKLAVVDVRNVSLAARFEVPSEDRIRILVDDRAATYPIVIDPLLTSTDDGQVESNQEDAFLGRSVAGAGDVNGDGYDDVIVGAENYDAGNTDEGAAFVFLGSATGIGDGNPVTAHAQLESNQGIAFLGPLFGASVASAGDVNGDGYSDVIVGSPKYNGIGAAFIFLGSAAGIADGNPSTANARITPIGFDEVEMGTSVASAGDVNGDGYSDVIVGAPVFDATLANEGAAFIFLGSASGIPNGTSATAHARLGSDQQGSRMGSSVASAGDVNGDGYDDVIVGAPFYSAGAPSEGVAFVYLGSATGIPNGTPATAHARLESDQGGLFLGSLFGTSVASAGDVNGDGYADVIVGAPFYREGEPEEGAAFVFHGSATGLANGSPRTANATIQSNQFGARLGRSVASAGDVNGDGYSDVIVGIPNYWTAAVLLGSAGGIPSGDASFGYRFITGPPASEFGWSVSSAGDVNGDGYSDVIVGGPAYEGTALVYHGGASGIPDGNPTTALARLEANQFEAQMGSTVASAGDVNGDGYGDVIVAASRYDAGETDEGAAFIFLGSASGIASGIPTIASAQLESNQADARMCCVASAGDVNGDGYGDVIVGAYQYDAGETNEGAAFIFLGSASGIADGNPTTARARLESDQAGAGLGFPVAGAGDVNGDGYGDVIVGATGYDAGESNEGSAFIFLGSASGIASGNPSTAHARLESNQASAQLGFSVASAGDVNGDGYGDVIVGAPDYQSVEGAAFVFLGSASGIAAGNPLNAHARFVSNQPGARMGHSVASAGDINSDGYSDVIVGAYWYDAGRTDEGSAFVFLGSAPGIADGNPLNAHARLEGDQAGAQLGFSVASAGDVNGDGYGDVIVGANGFENGQVNEGYAFLFVGSASGISNGSPTTAHARLASNQFGAQMGESVASAGDVNGDGYGDVIVGAYQYDAGETNDGAAFVFLGNAPGRPTLARQRRGDGSGTPVQADGAAYAPDRFAVELFARSPRGRERATLEVEVCPSGTAFGDVACTRQSTTTWVDLGTSGALLSRTLTGLAANTTYSWRARALYAPYSSTQPGVTPSVRSGPWFRTQARATPGDIRTVPEPGLWVGVIAGVLALAGAQRKIIDR